MKTCSSRPVITATKRHTRDFCRKPGAGAPEVSQMPCRQRCEGFCYQHMNAGKVGWDQRATRVPAHHRERCHRWRRAAYQPLVPPYGAENLKYTEKILHSVARGPTPPRLWYYTSRPGKRTVWQVTSCHRSSPGALCVTSCVEGSSMSFRASTNSAGSAARCFPHPICRIVTIVFKMIVTSYHSDARRT